MADHLCDWSTITQKWSENGQWLAVILHTELYQALVWSSVSTGPGCAILCNKHSCSLLVVQFISAVIAVANLLIHACMCVMILKLIWIANLQIQTWHCIEGFAFECLYWHHALIPLAYNACSN